MLDYTHTFKTVDGHEATITFKNTLLNDIRFMELSKAFAGEELADSNVRTDFCWVISRIESVEGLDWEPIKPGAAWDEFEQCYHAFAKMVESDVFYGCVRAVNNLKNRSSDLEKPDSALTTEEKADPN